MCTDTRCSLEDLPEVMDDRDGWREIVMEIHASSTPWRWWWKHNCSTGIEGYVWFYGISNIVGYLMPNPFFTYKHFYFKQFSWTGNSFFVYAQLNVKIVLFQAIRFSRNTQFLFDPQIGLSQVLPLQARMDRGAMAMRRYSTFPKARALLEPHNQII